MTRRPHDWAELARHARAEAYLAADYDTVASLAWFEAADLFELQLVQEGRQGQGPVEREIRRRLEGGR